MEKIKLQHEEAHLHLSIGISEERTDEMLNQCKAILKDAKNNGIMNDVVDEDGDLCTKLNGIKFLDMILNDVAQTELERIYLAVNFDDMLKTLRPKNPLEQLLNQFK
jgi:hypothetical protein